MKKYFYWMVLGIFLLSSLIAFVLVRTAPDCGLAEVRSVSDLMDKQVRIEWATGDPSPDMSYIPNYATGIRNGTESIIQQAKECNLVVLATAGDKLDVTDGTMGQEVTVDRVLQGTGITAGESCMIWRYSCLEEMSGAITLRSTTNLMEPGKQYLICLEENPLNEKTKTKNFPVSFSSGLIPADGTEVEALPKGMRTAEFREFAGSPQFAATEEIAQALNEQNQAILAAFGVEKG